MHMNLFLVWRIDLHCLTLVYTEDLNEPIKPIHYALAVICRVTFVEICIQINLLIFH